MWAALLTGEAGAQGRGTPGDEIRDATGRVPNLWFGDHDPHSGQRFHLEVYVAPEVAAGRIAAVLAAGGTVVDDSDAPSLTVIADQDGNTGVLCVDASVVKQGKQGKQGKQVKQVTQVKQDWTGTGHVVD